MLVAASDEPGVLALAVAVVNFVLGPRSTGVVGELVGSPLGLQCASAERAVSSEPQPNVIPAMVSGP